MPHSDYDILEDQAASGVVVIFSVIAVLAFVALLVAAIYPWGTA